MTAPSRVLIADDHPLFREALRHVVDRVCPGSSCVEASGHDDVIALTSEDERFDLIFVDLMMPGGDEFAELAKLRRRVPLTPTIVVSSRTDWPTIRRALGCGIAGYIPKSASKSTMEEALRRVLAGDVYVPDDERPHSATHDADALTPRQYAVLEKLSEGSSNKAIARDLGIEEITVKAHISAILRKLHVKNRWQAVLASRSLLDVPAPDAGSAQARDQ